MKFLQAAVLSAICVGYVTASDPDYFGDLGLLMAIDDGRLDIAVDLVKQDETLGRIGVSHVIRKDNPDLIVNFVNETNQANAFTLKVLLLESSVEIVEKVLEKVDFIQEDLVDVAASWGVASKTETFFVLLNKIVKPEDQEKAVEKGLEELVDRPTETFRLLNALKGKTFRSERLEYLAIQKAFMVGVKSDKIYNLPTDIYNHAVISPELYADALIVTADWWMYSNMRQFLLEQADRYDLEAVKERPGYVDLKPEFRGAIEKALKTAAPGGTRRPKYLVQSAKIAKETFDEITGEEFPRITDITGSFLTGRPTTRERAKAVRQTIGEVTETRSPEPTKEIDDILDAYMGGIDEE